jgi:putative transposase
MKLRARKRLAYTVTQEFIDRFVEDKRKKAKHSRRAASDLERTMRALADAPTANTRPRLLSAAPATSALAADATNEPAPVVEPQKLSIGYGYTTVI